MGIRNTNKIKQPKEAIKETLKDEEVEVEKEEVAVETAEEPKKEVAVKKETPSEVVAVGDIPPAPSMLSLRDAFPAEDFGTNLKRIVPASGSVKVAGDNTVLGKFIDIQLLSSSERWMVAPVADNKDKEAAKFCRASYDGKTIPDREGGPSQTIEEYTSSVDKYEEFTTKKYLDLFCLIIKTEDSDMQELAEGLGMVQVSISPTATGQYRAFEAQGKLSVMRGVMKAETQNCFRITAVAKSNDYNDYTVFTFSPIPHLDLEGYVPVTLT